LYFDAVFTWSGVEAEEVELFEGGELMGGMAGTGAHRVVDEDDVHAPMEAILELRNRRLLVGFL
jgi:hypothetical protein